MLCPFVPPRKSSPCNYEKRIEVLKEIEKAYDKNKVNMITGDYNLIDSIYDKPANVRVSYSKKIRRRVAGHKGQDPYS